MLKEVMRDVKTCFSYPTSDASFRQVLGFPLTLQSLFPRDDLACHRRVPCPSCSYPTRRSSSFGALSQRHAPSTRSPTMAPPRRPRWRRRRAFATSPGCGSRSSRRRRSSRSCQPPTSRRCQLRSRRGCLPASSRWTSWPVSVSCPPSRDGVDVSRHAGPPRSAPARTPRGSRQSLGACRPQRMQCP